MWTFRWAASVAALAVLAPAPAGEAEAQEPRAVQPGAPGAEGRTLTPEELTAPARPRHTAADVRFMRNMIHHHHQALVMTALAPDRGSRPDVLRLAGRIERAQADEIALMRRWLELRGEEAPQLPDDPGHHAGRHEPPREGHLMAGMLTREQLDALDAAGGAEFDRLFLELMIHHHEGALEMVAELFAAPGAARDTDIFHFASDVANDQQVEIARMRGMLAEMR